MGEQALGIFAQAVSIAATVAQISSYQFKSNRSYFIVQGIGGLLFSLSFFMIGATTAALINMINIFRSALMTYGERHRKIIIPISVCLAYTVAVICSFDGWFSLVLLATQIGSTLAMWSRDGVVIRIFQLIVVSPAWLVNNVIVSFSLGGIITEIFSIVSIIIFFIRYGFKGLRSSDEQKSDSSVN